MTTHISSQEDFEALERGFEAPAPAFHAQHHTGRYALVINIGLSNNPFQLVKDLTARAKAYAVVIERAFRVSALPVWRDTALLMQSHEATATREATDVLAFDVGTTGKAPSHAALKAHIRMAIYHIASTAEQEAIPVTWVDEAARDAASQERGQLLDGLRPEQWGEFDPALFIPYDTRGDHVAAKFVI